MKVSGVNLKECNYNVPWDPALGGFEPVVAVTVIAASGGGY